MQIDVIVLAGAKNDGRLQEVANCEYEALIPINGKPMINYVIQVLKSSQWINRIIVVGYPEMKSELDPSVILLEAGESLADNLKIGIDYLNHREHVLVITSDIPMLNVEALEDFLTRCSELEGDIFYPIISRESNENTYPGTERTYFHLKEGIFTGGNVVLIGPSVVEACYAMINRVLNLRKNPWRLVQLLGFNFILKFIMRNLSISEIEKRVAHLFGIKGIAVISPYPEIGTDIDKPSDWELAERVLSQQD